MFNLLSRSARQGLDATAFALEALSCRYVTADHDFKMQCGFAMMKQLSELMGSYDPSTSLYAQLVGWSTSKLEKELMSEFALLKQATVAAEEVTPEGVARAMVACCVGFIYLQRSAKSRKVEHSLAHHSRMTNNCVQYVLFHVAATAEPELFVDLFEAQIRRELAGG